jgi:hypothetical protein
LLGIGEEQVKSKKLKVKRKNFYECLLPSPVPYSLFPVPFKSNYQLPAYATVIIIQANMI